MHGTTNPKFQRNLLPLPSSYVSKKWAITEIHEDKDKGWE